MLAWFALWIISIICLAPAAKGEESLRIERPETKAISLEIDLVKEYLFWQSRYASPVFCPVYICNSSCKYYADACLLEGHSPVLKLFFEEGAACGGGCGSALDSASTCGESCRKK